MNIGQTWEGLCIPAQMYAIVVTGTVIFYLYAGWWHHAFRNIVSLVLGTFFLWVLCAAKLEVAAYGLLILPVVFFLFLFAIVFYDQSLIAITHSKKRVCGCVEEKDECGCDAS